MTGNQTMDYYVRPRHLYSHSTTCTRSGLCIRPSSLVASTICYLLDRASVHKISALMTWFQCMSDIFSFHGYFDLSILYMVMTTHVIFCIMPIHGHCTLMYPGLLYLLAVMCRVWLLYCTIGWMVLPSVSSSIHFWDGLIMYFSHHITPLTSHIRGNLL